jgi:hypothetical protein
MQLTLCRTCISSNRDPCSSVDPYPCSVCISYKGETVTVEGGDKFEDEIPMDGLVCNDRPRKVNWRGDESNKT